MTTERRKGTEAPLSTRSKVSSWIEELVPKTGRSTAGSKPLDLDRLAAALERADDDDGDPSSRRDAA